MKYASKVKMNLRNKGMDIKMNLRNKGVDMLRPSPKVSIRKELRRLHFIEVHVYTVDKRIVAWNFCFIIACLKLLLDFSLLE